VDRPSAAAQVAGVDTAAGAVLRRLDAGSKPTDLALSADGSKLVVLDLAGTRDGRSQQLRRKPCFHDGEDRPQRPLLRAASFLGHLSDQTLVAQQGQTVHLRPGQQAQNADVGAGG